MKIGHSAKLLLRYLAKLKASTATLGNKMDYREASSIAKANPGSTLTRNQDGFFVVHLRDGRCIASLENTNGPVAPSENSAVRSNEEEIPPEFISPEEWDKQLNIVGELRSRLREREA
jgi:hypothetical protein